MPRSKPPYPAEFRQQMVELVAAGRSPVQLAREFKCSEQSIHTWVKLARADGAGSGKRTGSVGRTGAGLSTAEREELARLRKENRQLKIERDILAKATAWFAGKNERTPGASTNS